MNTLKMTQKGFSLIELMVTVAIIGILAAIALPNYRDYVVNSSLAEATSGLADRRIKMEQYFQDNRSYAAGQPGDPCVTNNTGQNFNFTCASTATTYTFTASGKATAAGFTFTVNESNAKATTAAAAGWSTNATCWIRKKGGVC